MVFNTWKFRIRLLLNLKSDSSVMSHDYHGNGILVLIRILLVFSFSFPFLTKYVCGMLYRYPLANKATIFKTDFIRLQIYLVYKIDIKIQYIIQYLRNVNTVCLVCTQTLFNLHNKLCKCKKILSLLFHCVSIVHIFIFNLNQLKCNAFIDSIA